MADEKDSIFLTPDQAVEAICLDFQQYDPQLLLFSEIIGVLSKGDITVRRTKGACGIWVGMPGVPKMRWLEGPDLVEFMCDFVKRRQPDLEPLAALCSRVFQTRACPDKDLVDGRVGISVLTGMEDFDCMQCGQCCHTLDYRQALTPEDVAVWEKNGRSDILEWVGVFQSEDQAPVYRIWMMPGTREFSETCPFLQKKPHKNQWVCGIHHVKPGICRQYPVSRKHAIMTGCPGFRPTD